MDADPYHEAAFVCITLFCDNCPNPCHSTLDSEDIPGQPSYPAAGWIESLGDEARRRGWQIEFADGPTGFLILCPDCAKTARSASNT